MARWGQKERETFESQSYDLISNDGSSTRDVEELQPDNGSEHGTLRRISATSDRSDTQPSVTSRWQRVRRSIKYVTMANRMTFKAPPYQAFLSRQLHAFLIQNSNSDLDRECGRVQEAAVLFADCSGFTALTERLATTQELDGCEEEGHVESGAEELCAIINQFFEQLIKIAHVCYFSLSFEPPP
jgi:hypothetical protein